MTSQTILDSKVQEQIDGLCISNDVAAGITIDLLKKMLVETAKAYAASVLAEKKEKAEKMKKNVPENVGWEQTEAPIAHNKALDDFLSLLSE